MIPLNYETIFQFSFYIFFLRVVFNYIALQVHESLEKKRLKIQITLNPGKFDMEFRYVIHKFS